jgi:hypothetical protein
MVPTYRTSSNPAEQNQDQKDKDHKTEAAATVVASPVEGTASNPAESAQQNDDQDDKQDGSNRHAMISLVYAENWMCMKQQLSNRVVPCDL